MSGRPLEENPSVERKRPATDISTATAAVAAPGAIVLLQEKASDIGKTTRSVKKN